MSSPDLRIVREVSYGKAVFYVEKAPHSPYDQYYSRYWGLNYKTFEFRTFEEAEEFKEQYILENTVITTIYD